MPHHGSSRSQTDSECHWVTANFFRSFSDPTALMILDIVRKKEMTSRAMSKKLGIKPDILLTTVLTKPLKSPEELRVIVEKVLRGRIDEGSKSAPPGGNRGRAAGRCSSRK